MSAVGYLVIAVVLLCAILVFTLVALNRAARTAENWKNTAQEAAVKMRDLHQTYQVRQKSLDDYAAKLRAAHLAQTFNFPVNVPDLTRDDRIALAAFFESPLGKLLILRLRATCVDMALAAPANKQFVAERACEAHGYSECLAQIQSLSAVPTASDNPAPSQEDEAGIMLSKFSP